MSKDDSVLYEYTDQDGDQLKVSRRKHQAGIPCLRFAVGDSSQEDPSLVDLNAAAVNHLHALTGSWLADNGITQRATVGLSPKPLSVTDVRELVRQEVQAVLPLHLSPLAAVNPDPEGPEYCGCDKYNGGGLHFFHDPEPHDVGHPGTGPCGIDPVPGARCCPGCTPRYVPEPDAEEVQP